MKKGFTLIEIIVILAILSIIFSFTFINATTSQSKNDFFTNVDTISADIREQQMKAMAGDTEGRATAANYGVHFTSSNYTLFHGSTFDSSESTNFVIDLDEVTEFSTINLPSANLIFSQGSGQVSGFNASQNTVTLRNTTTGDTKILKFNKYGIPIP